MLQKKTRYQLNEVSDDRKLEVEKLIISVRNNNLLFQFIFILVVFMNIEYQ